MIEEKENAITNTVKLLGNKKKQQVSRCLNCDTYIVQM